MFYNMTIVILYQPTVRIVLIMDVKEAVKKAAAYVIDLELCLLAVLNR